MAGLMGAATVALFWSATRFEFLNLDDDMYVHGNSHVHGGMTVKGLTYTVTTTEGGSWMPLTWLSYLLDAQLWGDKPAGFHATNILLHAVAAVLLFLALRMMTREVWPSAMAAAVFAVHPLRLESVVWIAERKDVLSGVFFMLTLIAYARYAAKPGTARLAVTLLCLAIGLMAKPMLVMLPFLLLLLDVWPLRRTETDLRTMKTKSPALVLEKIPLFVVSLIFAVITYLSQSAAGAVVGESSSDEWRLLRIADNYGFYLAKLFWPTQLNVLYAITPLSIGRAALALALLLGITLIVLRLLPKRAWLAVGWLWFLGLLVPVIGLVPVGSTWVADRYTYLPSVGICVMFAWTMWTSVSKLQSRFKPMLASLLIPIALATLTIRNLPRWQSSITLFSDAVSKGEHPGAHQNLGVALAGQGDFETAIAHYTRSLELNPQSAEACYNRANAFRAQEKLDPALADYTRAIELKPSYAEAFNNRGSLHAAAGQFDAAIRDFTQAIALRGDYTEALANRGHAYLETGRLREAVGDYSKAIAAKPDFASAYHDRAVVFYQFKDYDRAWADLRACRKLGVTPNPELIRRLEADSGKRE